jgi:hypothetical protein
MHGTIALSCSQITGGPGSLRKKGQKSNTDFNSPWNNKSISLMLEGPVVATDEYPVHRPRGKYRNQGVLSLNL